jgi:hypothetical protein
VVDRLPGSYHQIAEILLTSARGDVSVRAFWKREKVRKG